MRNLFHYRLDKDSSKCAEADWQNILRRDHASWEGISSEQQAIILSFLIKFNSTILQCGRFDFRKGSIGNFFFTGARLVFNSLTAALWLYAKMAGIPEQTKIIPAVSTNAQITIAAELEDGCIIKEQKNISYEHGVVDKDINVLNSRLISPIKRLFSINQYGDSFTPDTNPELLHSLLMQDNLVYSFGSFFTSILSVCILPGVGEVIAKRKIPKIFMLNGFPDRETHGFTAVKILLALQAGLNRYGQLDFSLNDYVSEIWYVEGTTIPIDIKELQSKGLGVVALPRDPDNEMPYYLIPALVHRLRETLV